MTTINIKLPKNRLLYGTLKIANFSFRCLGRADNTLAKAHGNPLRTPDAPFGDTPLGTYNGSIVPAGSGSGALRSYGPNPRILLTPPPASRSGLMVHGGAPGNKGGLRPTEGCVRVSNDDMAAILKILGTETTCQVIIAEQEPSSGTGSV